MPQICHKKYFFSKKLLKFLYKRRKRGHFNGQISYRKKDFFCGDSIYVRIRTRTLPELEGVAVDLAVAIYGHSRPTSCNHVKKI